MNRPEWNVETSKDGTKFYAASDDFSHDVWLEISGDFWEPEQKREYAQKICDILNAHGPIVLPSDEVYQKEAEEHFKI